MNELLQAVIIGIVQGLTEFLPVSSTGHLILAGNLLGFTGDRAAAFDVFIQLGSILCVVILYRDRFIGLLKSRPGARFSGVRGLFLLFLTSLPASLLGLVAHSAIKKSLFFPQPVALALGVGALAILFVEARHCTARHDTLDDITPKFALGVGLFQCLSLWPGFSRSASTIMGGLVFGANRKLAAEYSFIAAVPIMVAATSLDLYKSRAFLSVSDIPVFSVGFFFAFVAAWAAIKCFIGLLERFTLRPFAYYRLVLAPFVFFFWS